MKIFIPTSNWYTSACQMTCSLLEKYWPNHPPADICHFENKPLVPNQDTFTLIDLGKQRAISWSRQMLQYATDHNQDELLMLVLDDYGLFQPVNQEAIDRCQWIMTQHPHLCSIALTWQPCEVALTDGDGYVEFPRWGYLFNTQAAIWRRKDFIDILGRLPSNCDVWQTEQIGSLHFNSKLYTAGRRMAGWPIPRPHNASGFVDRTDKTQWVFAYHNLVHKGKLDATHIPFLKAEGLL
jgi:hypothetical protein